MADHSPKNASFWINLAIVVAVGVVGGGYALGEIWKAEARAALRDEQQRLAKQRARDYEEQLAVERKIDEERRRAEEYRASQERQRAEDAARAQAAQEAKRARDARVRAEAEARDRQVAIAEGERLALAEREEAKRRAEDASVLNAAKASAQDTISKSRNRAEREANLLFCQKADRYLMARPYMTVDAAADALEDAKGIEFAQKHVARLSKNPSAVVFAKSTLRRAMANDGNTFYCLVCGEVESPNESPGADGEILTAKWCAVLVSNYAFGLATQGSRPSFAVESPEWSAYATVWDVKPKGK